jgi:hypothetical protein
VGGIILDRVSKKDLRMISAEFRDYGSRLLTTNDDTGIDDVKRLLNYIEKTEVIAEYISKCLENKFDIEGVIKNKDFWDKYPLPLEKDDEVSFIYSLLKYGAEKMDSYWGLVGHAYSRGSNKIQDHIDAFNDEVVRHFINHIVRYLENLSISVEENTVSHDICEKKVFISYCWADKDVADVIDEEFNKIYGTSFTRDERDLKFKKSIKSFMQTIGEHDFVVMIISDSYLKSDNCLYEVMEVMRDRRFREKILFILINDEDKKYYSEGSLNRLEKNGKEIECDVYSTAGRIGYIKYWDDKKIKITELIESISNPISKIEPLNDLKRIDNIVMNLGEFLESLSDLKNETLSELKESQFKSFAEVIGLI